MHCILGIIKPIQVIDLMEDWSSTEMSFRGFCLLFQWMVNGRWDTQRIGLGSTMNRIPCPPEWLGRMPLVDQCMLHTIHLVKESCTWVHFVIANGTSLKWCEIMHNTCGMLTFMHTNNCNKDLALLEKKNQLVLDYQAASRERRAFIIA